MTIKEHILDIPDFPSVGITYRDVSPILHNADAFRFAIDSLYFKVAEWKIDIVVGIEPRGIIFAAPLAMRLGVPMAEAKKFPSVHPHDVAGMEYAMEMGTNRIEIIRNAIRPGSNVLIVDDLLATGVTAKASADLVMQMGGNVIGFAFVADINYYDGLELLKEIAPVVHIYDC
ncbi:MAG: adenine phosphoribosyltransferase [Bacteroidota bacterium]|nr:adenine phosphoribosyltransferase [Bacteroidota bacterium]MDP4235379.1 adenine phosphoribosyltransferase [Bacteroidota bacterium]